MKTIISGNIYIEVETFSRFENLVRAYRVEAEEITGFLGKFIVGSNMTEEEIIKLYRKEGK